MRLDEQRGCLLKAWKYWGSCRMSPPEHVELSWFTRKIKIFCIIIDTCCQSTREAVFYCMSHFQGMVSVPLKNNELNSSDFFFSSFLWLHSLLKGVCCLSPFTASSWNCFICTTVSCKYKTMHLPFFLFFFLLKCPHEFAEHCIKFIKNRLILRL